MTLLKLNIQETIWRNQYENKRHAFEKSETNDHYNDQQNSMLLYIHIIQFILSSKEPAYWQHNNTRTPV